MLEFSRIKVSFGGVQVLHDVDLSVPEGAITGLIGPNGAGKTTLFNVATGMQRPGGGRVRLDGRDITRLPPHRRARMGLVRTFQRLEIFESLTARENLLVAAEARRGGGRPDVDELLARVGLTDVASRQADLLSTGQARLLEIARALAASPRLLLLDEPGSGLDDTESVGLGKLLLSLVSDGIGVLLVEHDVDLVMRVCDQIHVLDFGHVIARGTAAAIRANPEVRKAYLGTADDPAGGAGDDRAAPAARAPAADGRAATVRLVEPAVPARPVPAIELADVRVSYGRIEVLHGISLSVPDGSVCALLGPNGAGKTTTLGAISRRIPVTGGAIRVNGQPTGGQSPERLARAGLCAIPEGRGVFANLTVLENLRMWSFSGSVSFADIQERSFARFPRLAERRGQLAGTLSGGEQQMLAMSRALSVNPKVLLLDEISMGLAPIIVAELYDLVRQLAADGISILLVEQFAKTALEVADQVGLMSRGTIVRVGRPADLADAIDEAYFVGTRGSHDAAKGRRAQ